MFNTLIQVDELVGLIESNQSVLILDCRFNLMEPDSGSQMYLQSQIPGAHYVHLDQDLSGELVPGVTGRHPLPTKESFTQLLKKLGLTNQTQVVCYDDAGGAFASRAWWLLGWAGVSSVAVLDGGWPAWVNSGKETSQAYPHSEPSNFEPAFNDNLLISAEQIQDQLENLTLLDARANDRFHGENETIDPVAGHIPGAQSMPFMDNLDSNQKFLSPEFLRTRFSELSSNSNVVCYCGSGVTACHNILAMSVAGLSKPQLYAGSWSHWITDSSRQIEK